jgi:type VI secretion system protein ImpA
MPLRDDLLNPIPGDNPSGQNLRYDPVYDKIKEARREDEDLPTGEWQIERKLADFPLVIRLSGETLATRTKDLQLAAWLTEALLRTEGIAGLSQGLDLICSLLENFWDTLYPELEEGDTELRATPLDWVGSYLEPYVRRAPITRSGRNWFDFKQSRTVGYEADTADNEAKQQARAAAIAEGKITPEEFDSAVNSTSVETYEKLLEQFDGAMERLDALDVICQEKFGDAAPHYGKLRTALEEVRHTVNGIYQQKKPKPTIPEPEPEPEAAAAPEMAEQSWAPAGTAAAPARAPVRRATAGPEPVDSEDAIARIAAAAAYLRKQDPYSPAPYLALRGLRWGELRAGGSSPDYSLLAAPDGEARQELKRLSMESSWEQLLEAAETAMAQPCGRGWLDLQRYVVRACTELGSYYEPIALAVKSELGALLQDIPQLLDQTMMDDTPVANPETRGWIQAEVLTREAPRAALSMDDESEELAEGEPRPPDPYEMAMDAVRSGRVPDAIEMLTAEGAHERSGRARFQRRVQLAQVCLAAGHDSIAFPILEEIAAEIDRRGLEQWESFDVVAHPLVLLFKCLNKTGGNDELKRAIYARICRLDPAQALACSR